MFTFDELFSGVNYAGLVDSVVRDDIDIYVYLRDNYNKHTVKKMIF